MLKSEVDKFRKKFIGCLLVDTADWHVLGTDFENLLERAEHECLERINSMEDKDFVVAAQSFIYMNMSEDYKFYSSNPIVKIAEDVKKKFLKDYITPTGCNFELGLPDWEFEEDDEKDSAKVTVPECPVDKAEDLNLVNAK